MAKATPEEITRKKEYVHFLTNQIYKLSSQKKILDRQLEKVKKQLKDYEKEKKRKKTRSD